MKPFTFIKGDGIRSLEMSGEHLELKHAEVKGIIYALYEEWRKHNPPSKYFPCVELLKDSWCWKEPSGKTLPQRINKIMKTAGFVLDKSFQGALGNTLRETIPVQQEYYIDITNNFDWADGEYGDEGSCLWDGRDIIREEMTKDGRFYALRFHELGHNIITQNVTYRGIARAWIFRDLVRVRVNNRICSEYVYIIFNGYGKALRQQAAIFAVLANGEAKSIKLSNRNKMSGGLYINGTGYVIGHPHIVENMHHFDFGFKNSYDSRGENTREQVRLITDNMPREMVFAYPTTPGKGKKEKKYWRPDRSRKRIKKRRHKRTINNDLIRSAFYYNRDTIYYLLNNAPPSRPWIGKQHVLGYWKQYDRYLRGHFFSMLMKILSYKITNGGHNDNPKKKP